MNEDFVIRLDRKVNGKIFTEDLTAECGIPKENIAYRKVQLYNTYMLRRKSKVRCKLV